jgi:hypothetical protein
MTEFLKKVSSYLGTAEIRNIIAVISVLGAFAALYLMIFKPIPVENKETINLCVGFVLGSLIAGVNGYFFGASKSDKEKSED